MDRARTIASPLSPPSVERTTPLQDYNDGSAPFPYATECSAAAATATCDPATLVAEMDLAGSADPIALDITGTTGDAAVQPVSFLFFVFCVRVMLSWRVLSCRIFPG